MPAPAGVYFGIPENWEEMDQAVAAMQVGTSVILPFPASFEDLYEFFATIEPALGTPPVGIPTNWEEVAQSFGTLQQYFNGI